jgi:LytS/YehU family sensor histidine kinase
MLSKIKLTNNIMKRKSHMKNHLKHIMRLAMFYFSMFYYQTGILIKESYANEKKLYNGKIPYNTAALINRDIQNICKKLY